MNMQETWAPAAKKEEGEEESYEGIEANVCDLPVKLKWVIGTESEGRKGAGAMTRVRGGVAHTVQVAVARDGDKRGV